MQIISREQLNIVEENNASQQKTYEIANFQADFMKVFKKYNLGSMEMELQQQNKKNQIYQNTVQSIQNEKTKQQLILDNQKNVLDVQKNVLDATKNALDVQKNVEEKPAASDPTFFEVIKKKNKTLEKVQEILFKSYDHLEENLEKIDNNLKDMKPDTLIKIIDDIIIKFPQNQGQKNKLSYSSGNIPLNKGQKAKKKIIGLEGCLDKVVQDIQKTLDENKTNQKEYFNKLLTQFNIQNPDIIVDPNAHIPNQNEKMQLVLGFLQNDNGFNLNTQQAQYKVPATKFQQNNTNQQNNQNAFLQPQNTFTNLLNNNIGGSQPTNNKIGQFQTNNNIIGINQINNSNTGVNQVNEVSRSSIVQSSNLPSSGKKIFNVTSMNTVKLPIQNNILESNQNFGTGTTQNPSTVLQKQQSADASKGFKPSNKQQTTGLNQGSNQVNNDIFYTNSNSNTQNQNKSKNLDPTLQFGSKQTNHQSFVSLGAHNSFVSLGQTQNLDLDTNDLDKYDTKPSQNEQQQKKSNKNKKESATNQTNINQKTQQIDTSKPINNQQEFSTHNLSFCNQIPIKQNQQVPSPQQKFGNTQNLDSFNRLSLVQSQQDQQFQNIGSFKGGNTSLNLLPSSENLNQLEQSEKKKQQLNQQQQLSSAKVQQNQQQSTPFQQQKNNKINNTEQSFQLSSQDFSNLKNIFQQHKGIEQIQNFSVPKQNILNQNIQSQQQQLQQSQQQQQSQQLLQQKQLQQQVYFKNPFSSPVNQPLSNSADKIVNLQQLPQLSQSQSQQQQQQQQKNGQQQNTPKSGFQRSGNIGTVNSNSTKNQKIQKVSQSNVYQMNGNLIDESNSGKDDKYTGFNQSSSINMRLFNQSNQSYGSNQNNQSTQQSNSIYRQNSSQLHQSQQSQNNNTQFKTNGNNTMNNRGNSNNLYNSNEFNNSIINNNNNNNLDFSFGGGNLDFSFNDKSNINSQYNQGSPQRQGNNLTSNLVCKNTETNGEGNIGNFNSDNILNQQGDMVINNNVRVQQQKTASNKTKNNYVNTSNLFQMNSNQNLSSFNQLEQDINNSSSNLKQTTKNKYNNNQSRNIQTNQLEQQSNKNQSFNFLDVFQKSSSDNKQYTHQQADKGIKSNSNEEVNRFSFLDKPNTFTLPNFQQFGTANKGDMFSQIINQNLNNNDFRKSIGDTKHQANIPSITNMNNYDLDQIQN